MVPPACPFLTIALAEALVQDTGASAHTMQERTGQDRTGKDRTGQERKDVVVRYKEKVTKRT